MLTKNELILLSGLIYKIYTILDLTEMRESFLKSLKLLVESDMSTFELASDSNPYHVTDPVGIGTSKESMQHYLDEVQEYDYGRWTYAAPSGGVYRESDFMSDSARVKTPYYQNFFKPENIHYSAMLVIIRNQVFYGCVALFRPQDKPDFSERDLFILNVLQDHLGWRLEQEKKAGTKTEVSCPTFDELHRTYNITDRENQIINLLLSGISNQAICDQLHISYNTLKKHISNIYRKTGAHNWRDLMRIVCQS